MICLMLYPVEVLFALRSGSFQISQVPVYLFNCLIGNQGYGNPAGGLDICWFIYTLFLCKLIQQLTSWSAVLRLIIMFVFVIVALWYNHNGVHLHNAIINTSLAFPFYMIGGGIKRLENNINSTPLYMAYLMILFGCAMV